MDACLVINHYMLTKYSMRILTITFSVFLGHIAYMM